MNHLIDTSVLSRNSLWTLEAYAKVRNNFRHTAIAHKKKRTVFLGDNLNILFEDLTTVRYQIQEMLYIEKIFQESGIQDELSAYMPLLPTGKNFKATMMIEYPIVSERREALKRLRGIERQVYIQVQDTEKVYAIADEDLSRENNEKTSAVHFMRFELSQPMIDSIKQGISLTLGVDHEHYQQAVEIIGDTRRSLLADLH